MNNVLKISSFATESYMKMFGEDVKRWNYYSLDDFETDEPIAFKDKTFDYIFVGLERANDIKNKDILIELKRILKDEGKIIISSLDVELKEFLEAIRFIVNPIEKGGMIVRKPDRMLGEFYKDTPKKDNSFQVFHKMSLLASSKIDFSDALKKVGIEKVYIYGFGEIGQMLYCLIKDQIEVVGIIDKARAQKETLYDGIELILPEEIPQNDAVIIVTPSAHVADIIWQLMRNGINRKRLWSYNVLLDIVLKYGDSNISNISNINNEMQFLIMGASFENKGAQAMLFTTVSEIRRLYPAAVIWYWPGRNLQRYTEELKQQYNMLILQDGLYWRSELYEIFHTLSAVVDISGYALTSNFKDSRIIPVTQLALDYNIPIYFMPQSFGPFDFEKEVHNALKRLLPTAKVIFAREQRGYNEMKEKYQLENIYLSKDLVLQNKGIDLKSIYTQEPDLSEYQISDKNAVAIIPNMQTYVHGNREEILQMYRMIIHCLLQFGKTIYIVCHSDDNEVSNDIYELYQGNEAVILYDKEFDCIGYSVLVQSFQYIIASRYHAIVHAYKENVPCIAIGWAEKYRELLIEFQQERYVFDVREKIDMNSLKIAIEHMNKNYQKEKEIIGKILPEMQKENCFDVLWELGR